MVVTWMEELYFGGLLDVFEEGHELLEFPWGLFSTQSGVLFTQLAVLISDVLCGSVHLFGDDGPFATIFVDEL
jgi:hypothetical protein